MTSSTPRDGRHWSAYNDAQAGRMPRPLCREVLGYAGPGDGRLAVDLGCGSGIETAAMVEAGWRVFAADADTSTPTRVAHLLGPEAPVEVVVASFEEVRLPRADLVYAGYALPFVPPAHFPDVWSRAREALRPGGWLAVDLLGDRDGGAGQRAMTFLDRKSLDDLVQGLELVSLEEEDEDGRSFSGPKHWHVFHLVARAPQRR